MSATARRLPERRDGHGEINERGCQVLCDLERGELRYT